MALGPKQARFVEEFLVDLNATQAAIRAGYSAKTARAQGSRLLTNADIQEAIAEAQRARSGRVQIDQDRVLREIASIAFVDVLAAFDDDGAMRPIQELPDDLRRAIAGMEVDEIVTEGLKVGVTRKLKFAPKLQALTMLARHLGMAAATERHEHKFDDLTPEQVKERLSLLFGGRR